MFLEVDKIAEFKRNGKSSCYERNQNQIQKGRHEIRKLSRRK